MVYNYLNGKAKYKAKIKKIIDYLEDSNYEVRKIGSVPKGQIPSAIKTLCNSDTKSILVVGGDGLIHLCIEQIYKSQVPLLVIPAGSGNDFAREFNMSKDYKKQIDLLNFDNTASVDLIKITTEDELFYVCTSLTSGFSSQVNHSAEKYIKLGSLRYLFATLINLSKLKSFGIKITGKNLFLDKRISFLVIANTRYFGSGMKVSPDSNPNDQKLELVLIDSVSSSRFIRVFPKVAWGGHIKHENVNQYQSTEFTLSIDSDMWGDGEFLGRADEWKISVIPNAFNIFV